MFLAHAGRLRVNIANSVLNTAQMMDNREGWRSHAYKAVVLSLSSYCTQVPSSGMQEHLKFFFT